MSTFVAFLFEDRQLHSRQQMLLPIIGHHRQLMQQMERLYEQFYRRLYLFALTLVDDEEEARDVVSEVMAGVWQQWLDDDGGKALMPSSAYLYTATRNRCLDVLRHSQVHKRYAAMTIATDELSTDASVAEFEERIAVLYEAIGELPEPARSIVRCCCLNRLSYKEAAEVLGLSEAVVHRHIMKAYRLLRDSLPRKLH
jgi:RNA polymerase sigma-70 factor (ECF subfamily)